MAKGSNVSESSDLEAFYARNVSGGSATTKLCVLTLTGFQKMCQWEENELLGGGR